MRIKKEQPVEAVEVAPGDSDEIGQPDQESSLFRGILRLVRAWIGRALFHGDDGVESCVLRRSEWIRLVSVFLDGLIPERVLLYIGQNLREPTHPNISIGPAVVAQPCGKRFVRIMKVMRC